MRLSILSLVLGTTALAAPVMAEDLRMSWWGGDSRHTATQAALEVCGAKHGHTINPEYTGWSGHFEKLTTQIAGGTEADIMQVNWPWLTFYSPDGSGLADLREFSDIIDLDNWDEAQIAAGTMNGVLNGVPVSTTGRLFLFNKTTYEKAGLPLPTTWEELVAAGPVFKEKLGPDHYPFEAAGLDAALIVTLYGTQATGKALIDPATSQLAWTKDDVVNAINIYARLVESGSVESWPERAANGNTKLHENPEWSEGKIAGTYQWDSTYFKISDPLIDGQELVYSDFLTQDGMKTPGIYRKASMVFSISANSEKKKAAAQIINCLLNEPEGVSALGSTRGVPGSATARQQLLQADAIKPIQIEAQDKVINGEGPAIHPMMEFPSVRSAMADALELFAYGELSAEDAAEEMMLAIEEVLEDVRS